MTKKIAAQARERKIEEKNPTMIRYPKYFT